MLWSISSHADSLISLAEIVGVNILLSGDNAVVIALAARALPASQQQKAIVGGSVAAIAMRLVLTFFAVAMLQAPYLRLIGAGLLFWIGVKLLSGEEGDGSEIAASSGLLAAIRTILIADLVMSLDNVLAVAAAAKGDVLMVAVGLGISIPLVIFGAKVLIGLIGRFPFIVTLGAALIGYTAGEMAISDLAVKGWLDANVALAHDLVPPIVAAAVVAAGTLPVLRRRPAEDRGSALD